MSLGYAVKFLPAYAEGDNRFLIEAVEDRGDRLLVRIHNGMHIKPSQSVDKSQLMTHKFYPFEIDCDGAVATSYIKGHDRASARERCNIFIQEMSHRLSTGIRINEPD